MVLLMMTFIKYYNVFEEKTLFSPETLRLFLAFYDPLFIGNLFWIINFTVTFIAVIFLLINIKDTNLSPLRWLLTLSLFTMFLIILYLFLPFSASLETFLQKISSLGTKTSKTITLSIIALLVVFFTISICIISFSALHKFYIFRAIWLTIISIFICLLIIIIYVNTYKDDYNLIQTNKIQTDAGIVLGAAVWGGNRPSPILRERINKGYELFKNNYIKAIVLTGGGSPGETTEAEVARNELIKKGVDEKYIYIENKSNSTLEQITLIHQNFYKKNNWNNIILISDGFHLLRASQICKFLRMNSMTVSSDTPLSTESGLNFSIKESFALILFWLFGIG